MLVSKSQISPDGQAIEITQGSFTWGFEEVKTVEIKRPLEGIKQKIKTIFKKKQPIP